MKGLKSCKHKPILKGNFFHWRFPRQRNISACVFADGSGLFSPPPPPLRYLQGCLLLLSVRKGCGQGSGRPPRCGAGGQTLLPAGLQPLLPGCWAPSYWDAGLGSIVCLWGWEPCRCGEGTMPRWGTRARRGSDAMVEDTGSSGRRAGDRVGWGQAAAVQGGREPIQAALWRAQSWKPRRYSHGPGLDVAPGSYFPSQNLGV